ncbi:hypothetical protein [Rhizobium sp. BK251]|uniref:hypothetical protein n=1 Tax=Rhizobium sp. BK251 TaxID=2512125 RepID=UPI0010506F06|nr:hypothetical protein [Rhizobium sp. BK251]TCL67192.1 hypothetical protein EV286_11093 [Rhizobium sp. BK251]
MADELLGIGHFVIVIVIGIVLGIGMIIGFRLVLLETQIVERRLQAAVEAVAIMRVVSRLRELCDRVDNVISSELRREKKEKYRQPCRQCCNCLHLSQSRFDVHATDATHLTRMRKKIPDRPLGF